MADTRLDRSVTVFEERDSSTVEVRVERPAAKQEPPAAAAAAPGAAEAHAHDDSSTARRILRNFLSLSGANVVCKGLAVVSTAYLARVLNPAGFGILAFAQAVVVYFQLLINQGLDTYGTREIARDGSRTRRYVDSIVTIRFALAAAAYALLAVFAFLVPKPPVVKAAILILGAKLFEITFNLGWVFQGRERMHWIAAERVLQELLYVAGVFLLIRDPEAILRVPMLQVATFAAGAALLIVVYRRTVGPIRPSFDRHFWREIFRESLPMAASYLLIQVYVNFDVVMLGFMRPDAEVGLYSAAYKIVTVLNAFGIYYFMTLFPNVARLWTESPERMGALLAGSLRRVVMIASPLCVGGTILAGPLVRLAFGDSFAGSAVPLAILVWGTGVIWISLHYGNTLIACNRQRRYLAGVAIGAALNLALNAVFIPRFGMTAAALTTLAAELAVFLFMWREMRGVTKLPILSALPKPLLASLGMGAILLALPEWNAIALVAVGAAVYFALLVAIGGLTKSDISFAASTISGSAMGLVPWRKNG